MTKYLLTLSLFIFSCNIKEPITKQEPSLIEKHKSLRLKYHKLMGHHLQENLTLDTSNPEEKELSLVHIELAKEYAKLYLKEDGIIKLLEEESTP
jgi:hypothetical protein